MSVIPSVKKHVLPVFGLDGRRRGLHRVNPVSGSMKLMRSSFRFCWEITGSGPNQAAHSVSPPGCWAPRSFDFGQTGPLHGLLYHTLREGIICTLLCEPFYQLTELLQCYLKHFSEQKPKMTGLLESFDGYTVLTGQDMHMTVAVVLLLYGKLHRIINGAHKESGNRTIYENDSSFQT